MLLPQAWLRKRRLERALRGYPLYDPPHKVEERLLSQEKAAENFEYFMRVREQRLAFFRDWLRRHFGVTLTADERGVRALNRWGNKYAGLLQVTGPDGHPTSSYFTYEPAWTGEYAGLNVLFDMGIALGEFIIANCPKLHWEVDPISALLPREARVLKRTPGTSFQRPMLTGFDNPVARKEPFQDVYLFATQMMRNLTTFKGVSGYRSCPPEMRRLIRDELFNNYKGTLRDYPKGDPYNLREQIAPEDYLKFMDADDEEEDIGNE
jgi:hypothetical protein